ncbi:MAG TPA: hypothetical protein DEA08_22875, partial [Planctomycetes bacterium]|nr:hypothetical protein [Planctomycetota bacterium]
MSAHDSRQALDQRVARAAGLAALATLAGGFAALTCAQPTLLNRAGDLGAVLLYGLICGLGFFLAQDAAEGRMGPKSAAFVAGLGFALLSPLVVLQGAYCGLLWETGSFGDALQSTLSEGGGVSLEVFVVAALSLGVPAALASYLRFWAAPIARKAWFAGLLTLLASAYLGLGICDQRSLYLGGLSGFGRSRRLFPHLSLALTALLPLASVGAEWRWGPRRRRARQPQRSGWRELVSQLSPGVAAILLPLLAFLLSESVGGPRKPTWAAPQLRVWRDLALTPDVQRGLYPLLAWSMVAFALYRSSGTRSAFVRVGLEGGVLLALLYAIAYLPFYPLSAALILGYGVGLLGLSPLFALVSYSNAWLDARAGMPPASAATHGLRGLWLGVFGAGLWRAAAVAVELHQKLP